MSQSPSEQSDKVNHIADPAANQNRSSPAHRKWPLAIVISALATAGFVFFDAGGPLRAPVTLGFLLICPGMAFIPLLRLKDAAHELILAVALSLALDLIVAAALLYTGLWFPPFIMAILIGLSLIGVQCQLLLTHNILAQPADS